MILKHSLGQHVLKNTNVCQQIVALCTSLGQEPSMQIVEIGPGQGALTAMLAETFGRRFWAIEYDKDMVDYLLQSKIIPATQLIQQDILQWDGEQVKGKPLLVVGNLPYNIAAPIVIAMREKFLAQYLVCMVQKEFAETLLAQEGSKVSRLGVWLRLQGSLHHVCEVAPQDFHPPPKVNSTVFYFEANNALPQPHVRGLLRIAFTHKRKTLGKNLMRAGLRPEKSPVPLHLRAEQLTLEQWRTLAQWYVMQGT